MGILLCATSVWLAVPGRARATTLMVLLAVPGSARATTLESFLAAVRVHHPGLEASALSGRLAESARRGSRGTSDPRLELSTYASAQKPLGRAPFSIVRADSLGSRAGVEKVLWATGGRLSVDRHYRSTEIQLRTDLSPRSLELLGIDARQTLRESELRVSYTQPLLRNLGGVLDRVEYEVGGDAVAIAELEALEEQEEILAALAVRYLEWVFAHEHAEALGRQRRRAERLVADVRARRQARLVDEVDLLRAVDYLQQLEQGLALARAHWRAQGVELAALARIEMTVEDDLYAVRRIPPVAIAQAELRRRSRLLETLELRQQSLRTALGASRNDRWPELNLTVAGALKQSDADWRVAIRPDRPEWLVSLQLRVPFGNSAARAQLETARLRLRRADAEARAAALRMESALERLSILIGEYEAVLAGKRAAVQRAAARAREEVAAYDRGRADLTVVLRSQNDEETAQIDYARSALAYQTLVVQYRALSDQLL